MMFPPAPYDAARRRTLGRMELALLGIGTVGVLTVFALRNQGRTTEANYLTFLGILGGSFVGGLRILTMYPEA